MRFNEFHESIYVIKEAVLAIASFFCSKSKSHGYEGFFIFAYYQMIGGKGKSDIWNTGESVACMKLTLPAFCFFVIVTVYFPELLDFALPNAVLP
ncbi:hypothetical protein [Peribacillus simplex]|uniref:hypothetical protein n=1 Tax=Peribacillus simplex TaxID=1478 RepID=UPI00333A2E92